MGLTRSWSRQLFGASGVALAVPATLAVVLAVLAVGGSFGHLEAVGQIVEGPSLTQGAGAATGRAGGTPQLAAALALLPGHAAGARNSARSDHHRGTSATGGAASTGALGSGHHGGGGAGTKTGHPSGGSPGGTTTKGGQPSGGPVAGLLTDVGNGLAKLTAGLKVTVGNLTGALASAVGKLPKPLLARR